MTKKGLISKTVDVLRNNNIRKPISIPKQVFHISDDEGNKKDFTVRKTDKSVLYNSDDVSEIIDAVIAVIEDSIKRGEEINISGFGSLSVHKRAARTARHPETGRLVNVEERYVPKFSSGKNLKMAARVYEASLVDNEEKKSLICGIDDGSEEELM